MIKVELNTSIDVSEKEYNLLMSKLSGIIAGQCVDGQHRVKAMVYAGYAESVINQLIPNKKKS